MNQLIVNVSKEGTQILKIGVMNYLHNEMVLAVIDVLVY